MRDSLSLSFAALLILLSVDIMIETNAVSDSSADRGTLRFLLLGDWGKGGNSGSYVTSLFPDNNDGDFDDDYLIRKDGEIVVRKTDDSFDRFYTENNQRIDGSIIIRNYSFVAKLDKNDAGLVNFPDNGIGFTSYGATEKGGYSSGIKKGVSFKENVGSGDSYLKPQTAAALFGVIDGLHDKGITVSLGDMSSSNGSDPANAGKNTFHHAGHGHMTKRSGLDADFRYIGKNGSSFQGVMSNKKFNVKNNQTLYNLAKQFGFDPQNTYQGTSARIPGVKKMGGHNNHGHLGMKRKPTNFTPYKPYVQK